MDAEQLLNEFLKINGENEWVSTSDGYQKLFEEVGDKLIPGLLKLLEHPLPEIRITCVGLLATRRPHTPDIVEAFRSLLYDANPLVRMTTLQHLIEFGPAALPLSDDVYGIVLSERDSEDQSPRICAIRLLLSLDRNRWENQLVPELWERLESSVEGLSQYLIIRTLVGLGLIEGPEEWK